MLQIYTIIGIAIAIWLPLIDYGVFRKRRRALADAPSLKWMERAVYFFLVVFIGLMAVSSFGMLAIGSRMHRWMLIVHMSIAPAFAVCLTILAFMWAEQSRFTRQQSGQKFYTGEKFAFWVTVLAGFLTISSAMLGMMTWFGSKGQDVLLNLHRVSAMLLVISTTFQAARLWVSRPSEPAEPTRVLESVGASQGTK